MIKQDNEKFKQANLRNYNTDNQNLLRKQALVDDKSQKPEQKIGKQVQNLSVKLKFLKAQHPRLEGTVTPKFSVKLMTNPSISQTISPFSMNPAIKRKIKWTNCATILTRQKSPQHSIPKAIRFKQPTLEPIPYDCNPEVLTAQRKKLKHEIQMGNTGISFARSVRKELFKPSLLTPSPNEYNLRRYLQKSGKRARNYIDYRTSQGSQQQIGDSGQHITGGAMGRFNNYTTLYYPHSKKLSYNEKIIKQEEQRIKQWRKRYRNMDMVNSLNSERKTRKFYSSQNRGNTRYGNSSMRVQA